MKKLAVCGLLTLCLLVMPAGEKSLVFAEDAIESSEFTGLEQPEPVAVPDELAEELLDEQEVALSAAENGILLQRGVYGAHSGSNSSYAKYTNDVFYDNMSAGYKSAYDALYEACDTYLTGSSDLTASFTYSGRTYHPVLVKTALTPSAATDVARVFMFSNPQFWFLNGTIFTTNSSGVLGLDVYEAAVSGASRSAMTARMMNVVNAWVADVAAQGSDLAKEKRAHDLLTANVSYGWGDYNQGAYSAFVGRTTVCAGYSEAFAMLMNAVGIPTISVTSTSHEWNQIYIDGAWRIVDVTWDDAYSTMKYYNQRESYIYQVDKSGSHVPESFWVSYGRPSCITPGDESDASSSEAAPTSNTNSETTRIPNRITMYRLYNPNSGEHFYTANPYEVESVVAAGWNYEGEAWVAPDAGAPVYRMYNPNAGDHHYTPNAAERDHLVSVGWNYEGIGWYSGGSVPLYRAYNPNAVAGAHHYTTSYGEFQYLTSIGWNDEGVGWYGYE